MTDKEEIFNLSISKNLSQMQLILSLQQLKPLLLSADKTCLKGGGLFKEV